MGARMIFEELRSLVGNEGGFVHKKLLGLAGTAIGFVPGGGLVKTGLGLASRAFSRTRTPRPTVPRTETARVTVLSEQNKQLARQIKFSSEDSFGGGGTSLAAVGPLAGVAPGTKAQRIYDQCFAKALRTSGSVAGAVALCLAEAAALKLGIGGRNGSGATPCDPPLVRDARGLCLFPGSPAGAEAFGGESILGQYGAGMVAGSQIVDRAVCLKGMQLGNDGVCYNKSQISNKQRMWPAGRKPLLTGGDMRAISTAARAGRRLELATKRLQKMGMMKKPTTRGRTLRGHVARLEHASQH